MTSSLNLAEILSKINDGIYVLDSNLQVVFTNERASEILQQADAEFHRKILQAAKDHNPICFEHFHVSVMQWMEHQTYANADGGLTVISRDITSRHRMEEALRASEERFRRIVESNIIGVVVAENGMITEANDVFLNMVGYDRADLIKGELWLRQMTPSEFDSLDDTAQRELETAGVFASHEKEFVHKNGRRVPVLIGGVVINAREGSYETLCLVSDLSERKRSENRLRAILEGGKILTSSLEYQKTLPELAEFIASKLAESCVVFLKEEKTLVRMAAAHSAPINGDAECQAAVNHVLNTGRAEMTLSPMSRIVAPIVSSNDVTGAIVVSSSAPSAFDAEDLRLFEVFGRRTGIALQNARLYQETQKANRLKDEFVAIISHELRTPLTPILGGVYMIRSEPQDEKIFSRALDLIERNAKTQVKIVDDLLDVSRALSGKLRLNIETVDLVAVVQAAVDTIRPAIEAKRIQIDTQLRRMRGFVSGDADRLQQVVWNLLANAVKFTPEGGRISVDLAEEAGSAEIRVTDSGIGIGAEFLPHVFDRFRQADTSRTRPYGGLGLGLAIVRHLVESHGGTVQAHSSGNEKGSTFVVKLPLRAVVRTAREGV